VQEGRKKEGLDAVYRLPDRVRSGPVAEVFEDLERALDISLEVRGV